MPALPPPFTLRRVNKTWYVYQHGSDFARPATREEIWLWAALKRAGKKLAEAREVL